MNFEEKYNGALERAKALCNDADTFTIYDITTIFPELEEKMIQKDIISYLRNEKIVKRYISDIEIDKWIAWLEKQGKIKTEMIDKACEWLHTELYLDHERSIEHRYATLEELLNDFRKAMEGGES